MMPSLRQKVTTYFRQLSFIAEPRDNNRHLSSLSPRKTDHENFITKYLEGRMESVFSPGPDIKNGVNPHDLPDLPLAYYPIGPNAVTAACTGPEEGLTGIKRSKLHLSAGPDIDFIDTNQEQEIEIRKSTNSQKYKTSLQKFRSDQNPNKLNQRCKKNVHKNDNSIENSNTKLDKATTINVIVSMVSTTLDDKKTLNPDLLNLNVTPNNGNETNSCSLTNEIHNETTSVKEKIIDKFSNENPTDSSPNEPIAGVSNWKMENEHCYGISVSLYENNSITNEAMGNPIADCFGLVVRGNCGVMALADGVNWGEGARLASRSAIRGSLEYLDTAIFGIAPGSMATSTRDVFVSLLRSFWEAHACILEVGGALSTLTIAVVLPLSEVNEGKYVVCGCNVGDSLGYIYSKRHGVREFTQGSHDTTSMRDMRDALGALGPVDGNKPELSNLTLSMTIVDPGDIIFLTSDGISDNFDPVVGKFADACYSDKQKSVEPGLAPKRQNKSASTLYSRSVKDYKISDIDQKSRPSSSGSSSGQAARQLRNTKQKTMSGSNELNFSDRPKYLRSHTVIEPRTSNNKSPTLRLLRSPAGLPLVTGSQRHMLTLLRLEDLLSYGINGTLRPCQSARNLCNLLVDFAKMITSARRKMLEQRELFYKVVSDVNGIKKEVELTRAQHRAARKRIIDGNLFSSLPGKLDHATVVAYTIGSGFQSMEFTETNF